MKKVTPTRLKLRSMGSAVKWQVVLPDLPAFPNLGYAAIVSVVLQAMTPVPVFLTVAGVLFAALLFAMTGELGTRYAVLDKIERPVFMWEREITGKFLLLFLVIVSLVFDLVVYLVARKMPGNLALLDDGYLLVTITCELWLFAAQMAGTITNIRSRVGSELIPPIMNFAVDQIRFVLDFIKTHDSQRLKRADPATHPPRWYDHLNMEDFRIIKERVEARQQGKEITEPVVLSTDEESQ